MSCAIATTRLRQRQESPYGSQVLCNERKGQAVDQNFPFSNISFQSPTLVLLAFVLHAQAKLSNLLYFSYKSNEFFANQHRSTIQ
jgi:hypothetical protein